MLLINLKHNILTMYHCKMLPGTLWCDSLQWLWLAIPWLVTWAMASQAIYLKMCNTTIYCCDVGLHALRTYNSIYEWHCAWWWIIISCFYSHGTATCHWMHHGTFLDVLKQPLPDATQVRDNYIHDILIVLSYFVIYCTYSISNNAIWSEFKLSHD